MRPVKLVSDTIDKTDIKALVEWLDVSDEPIPQLTKGVQTLEFEKDYSEWLSYSSLKNELENAEQLIRDKIS